MVLNILKCSASAEGAELLLPLISRGTGFDQIGTGLLAKALRQTNQALACSTSVIIMKKQNYSDFSFLLSNSISNCVLFFFFNFFQAFQRFFRQEVGRSGYFKT